MRGSLETVQEVSAFAGFVSGLWLQQLTPPELVSFLTIYVVIWRWKKTDQRYAGLCIKLKSVRLIMNIEFDELTHQNFSDACSIDRDDIPEDFADTTSTIMSITDYGANHHCIGHTFVVKCHDEPIGLILLGEAISWKTDPPEKSLFIV